MCEGADAGFTLVTVTPGRLRYFASYESDSEASIVNLLPEIAVILRCVTSLRDWPIHVCRRPSRLRSSICINLIHAAVVGRRIAIKSPTANPLASATVKLAVPDGTYASAIVVSAPTNAREAADPAPSAGSFSSIDGPPRPRARPITIALWR